MTQRYNQPSRVGRYFYIGNPYGVQLRYVELPIQNIFDNRLLMASIGGYLEPSSRKATQLVAPYTSGYTFAAHSDTCIGELRLDSWTAVSTAMPLLYLPDFSNQSSVGKSFFRTMFRN